MGDSWKVPCAACGCEEPEIRKVKRKHTHGGLGEWYAACCDGCRAMLGDFETEHMARQAWYVSNSVEIPPEWRGFEEKEDEWWL